jgi:hypothetical protein
MSEPRKSFYILLPLFSCVFALLLLEAGLALFYPIPYSLEKNMYFEADPYTGYRHKPEGVGYYPTGIPALANKSGHRDDEVQIPKPAGVFRILMIGDSFTIGANVEQAEAYPQVLEALLNQPGQPKIEVVNAGVGGWSPFQYAEFLKHYGARYEPDLVLVGLFVGNDIYIDRFDIEQTMTAVLGRRVSREAAQSRWIKLRVYAYEHSHIARALMAKSPDDMDFTRRDCGDFLDYYIAVQANRVHTHLAKPSAEMQQQADANIAEIKRMQEAAESMGAKLAVIILPDENQINPLLQQSVIPESEQVLYDFEMPQSYLRERFAVSGIASLDLLEPIRSDERCLFMNDTHWIPAGHALVAEQIRSFLQSSGLLPESTLK